MRIVRNGGAWAVALLSAGLLIGCGAEVEYETETETEPSVEKEYELSTNGKSGKDFQPVALGLDGSSPPQDLGPGECDSAISVDPDPVSIRWENRPNRVVWVIPEKDPRDEWVISWKGAETGSGVNYFPTPKTKVIGRGADDAYLLSVPCPQTPMQRQESQESAASQETGECAPPPPGESVTWEYTITVSRDLGNDEVQEWVCDPKADIYYP